MGTEFDGGDISGFDVILATTSIDETVYEPVTMEELRREQLHDRFCVNVRHRLNEGEDVAFRINDEGVLTKTSAPYPQTVVPGTLKSRILHMSHYAKTAGHPEH